MTPDEADNFKPKVVIVEDDNTIAQEFEGLE
jgi:aspartate 1-decarboxylase